MFGRMRAGVRTVGTETRHILAQTPAGRDPAVRHYFSSKINWFFLFASAVLYAVAWPTLPLTHDLPAYALPVVAAVAAWPVALVASAPLLGWAISLVGAQVIGLVVPTTHGWPWTIQVTHIIALLVLTFASYLRCPLRWLPLVWVASSLVMAVAAPPEARAGWVFGLTSLAVFVVLIRMIFASRRQLAERTEERRVAESETAVLQERARIARDLHDVVAHRMSMVVVMAQTARYRLTDVGPESAAEFDAIADAARSSLDEVRQLLGVLRVPDGTASAAPNPGLDDVQTLVAQTSRAGTQVMLHDELDHTGVGEASALVIYRIIQESLANATRHAPGSRVDVRLRGTESGDCDVLVVNSAPTGKPLQLGGAGAGIPGMRDRAASVGGTAVVGPTDIGGFSVRARIPATVASTTGLHPSAVGDLPTAPPASTRLAE